MLFKSLVGSLLAVTAIAAPMMKTVPTTFLLRADGGNNVEMSPADIVSYANCKLSLFAVATSIYSNVRRPSFGFYGQCQIRNLLGACHIRIGW